MDTARPALSLEGIEARAEEIERSFETGLGRLGLTRARLEHFAFRYGQGSPARQRQLANLRERLASRVLPAVAMPTAIRPGAGPPAGARLA